MGTDKKYSFHLVTEYKCEHYIQIKTKKHTKCRPVYVKNILKLPPLVITSKTCKKSTSLVQTLSISRHLLTRIQIFDASHLLVHCWYFWCFHVYGSWKDEACSAKLRKIELVVCDLYAIFDQCHFNQFVIILYV